MKASQMIERWRQYALSRTIKVRGNVAESKPPPLSKHRVKVGVTPLPAGRLYIVMTVPHRGKVRLIS